MEHSDMVPDDDFPPVAVEGIGPSAAEGTAARAEPYEPDPDWRPL